MEQSSHRYFAFSLDFETKGHLCRFSAEKVPQRHAGGRGGRGNGAIREGGALSFTISAIPTLADIDGFSLISAPITFHDVLQDDDILSQLIFLRSEDDEEEEQEEEAEESQRTGNGGEAMSPGFGGVSPAG